MKHVNPFNLLIVLIFVGIGTIASVACIPLVQAQTVRFGLIGPPVSLSRQFEIQAVTLNTSEATTPVIEFGGANNGTIYIPTGSGITSLTYYAGYDTTVAFLPLNTNVGTPVAVTQTVAAAKSYDLPDAVRGARFLKIVTNASGAVIIVCKG